MVERGYKADDIKKMLNSQVIHEKRNRSSKNPQQQQYQWNTSDNILQQIHPKHLPKHEQRLVYFEDK